MVTPLPPLPPSMSLVFNRNKANMPGSEQLTWCRLSSVKLARPVYPDSHFALSLLFFPLSFNFLYTLLNLPLFAQVQSPLFLSLFFYLRLSLLKLILRGDVLGRKQRYLSAPNALKHVGSCTCLCLSSSPETEQ